MSRPAPTPRYSARTTPRRRAAGRLIVVVIAFVAAVAVAAPPVTAQTAGDPATFVVTYRSDSDAPAVERVADRVGDVADVTPQLDRVTVDADDATAARSALAATPGVESVVEDVSVQALNLNSWNLRSRSSNAGAANAYAAQARTTGTGVTVAVIDTGVDANPDLPASRVLTGRNVITDTAGGGDGEGHGTHVAGTVAQDMSSTYGADSVAPGATILPVRALSSTGSGFASDVADAIVWAADQGAKVLNLSLGADNTTDARSIICPAVDYAVQVKGATVIAAVGNTGASSALVPAACGNSLAIGAVDAAGALPSYSNRVPGMLVAPGGGGTAALFVRQMTIDKTNPNWSNPALRTYAIQGKAGTSMAAPHVAGAVALMRAVNPALTPTQVRSILYGTAVAGPSGYLQLDVAAAVEASRPLVWRSESLDGLALPAGSGRAVDAEVGDHTTTLIFNGTPHVWYADDTNGRLRHAWWTGTAWQFEDLDGTGVAGGQGRSANRVGAGASSLIFNGTPHVWYLDDGNKRLRHGWWTGSSWRFEDLDGNGVAGGQGRVAAQFTGRTAGILFGNAPHVWYHDDSNGRLRHAWWTGAVWQFENLDGTGVSGGGGRSNGDVGTDASVVSFAGGPHVFYRDESVARLRHGWWTGAVWQFEDLDGAGVPGGNGRVAAPTGRSTATVLYDSRPHVWYQPDDGSALRHAWWTGVTWAFESNDTAAACGVDCTPGTEPTVVVFSGEPHVFHGTGITANLRHSWWNGSSWSVENLDGDGVAPDDGATSAGVGRYPSVVLFGGLPHVFHASDDLGRLRHAWYG